MPVVGASEAQFRQDLLRLRDRYFTSAEQLLTLRIYGVNPSVEFMTFACDHDLAVAAELVGQAVPDVNVPGVDPAIFRAGLISEGHNFNHCVGLDDRMWQVIRDRGAAVNLTPRSDPHFGIGTGFPAVMDAQRFGVPFGISSDNELSYGMDLFTEMRVLLLQQRSTAYAHNLDRDAAAAAPSFQPRDVLAAATLGGARNAGLQGRIGALKVGMKADLIGLNVGKLHLQPWGTAIGTIVNFAHPCDVDVVFVNGAVRKWAGALVGLDVDGIIAEAWASREHLLTRAGIVLDSTGPGLFAADVMAGMADHS
jgi:5-methylthioadenosine/S-adenosylhomocysteine deaminase